MSFVVNIDLGGGMMDDLRVTPNTDIKVLASRFCMKHNLPTEAEDILINEIRKNCNTPGLSPIKNEAPEESILSTNTTFTDKFLKKHLITKPSFTNPGVKLYEKGIRYLEIISSKVEKFKKMQEENENKNLTFSPSINKNKYRRDVNSLLRAGLKTEEKLEKMRGEKLNSEYNQCTFSPSISQQSSRIIEKKRSYTPEKASLNTSGNTFRSSSM